jgi:site-specific DNA-adenine methylase
VGKQYYTYEFFQEDHRRLAQLLYQNDQKHKWLLTYHDHPLVRDLYSGWTKMVAIRSDRIGESDTLAITGN